MSKEATKNETDWGTRYLQGFDKYMRRHHHKLYEKFYTDIHPPQHIGDHIVITQGKVHTDEDYMEIMTITKDFCSRYLHPEDFPADF